MTRFIELENQRHLDNLRDSVAGLTDRALACHTIGLSNNIIKITRTTELLEHSLRQKLLTKDQEELLDFTRTEYERALDILETKCVCKERKK